MFEIFDLLDDAHPTLSPELVAERLDLTRSTTYRYLKLLCDAGMLVQLRRGQYSLGSRIIELDRKIQVSDPLLAAGREVMPRHANAVPDSVLLLCGLWGDRVLCLHQQDSQDQPSGGLAISRARGLPFSLFKGAASLSILSNLPSPRIKSLYLRFAAEIAEAGLGDTWIDFRKRMLAMRQAGYAMTQGTFASGLAAVSAPVLNPDGVVVGSLTRVFRNGDPGSHATLIDGVKAAAAEVSDYVANENASASHIAEVSAAENDASLLDSVAANVSS